MTMIYREHLDYFGVAATAYLLLFSSYMDIVKVANFHVGLIELHFSIGWGSLGGKRKLQEVVEHRDLEGVFR